MKHFILMVFTLLFVGCSSQVPNATYYHNLKYTNGNQANARPYLQQNPNSSIVLKETLYREREWHRREISQKDATIEGLRKELLETRAYVATLMSELNKVQSKQRESIALYETQEQYQHISYASETPSPAIQLVSQVREVREPIQRTSVATQEEPQDYGVMPINSFDEESPIPVQENQAPPLAVQPPVQQKIEMPSQKPIPKPAPVKTQQIQNEPKQTQTLKSSKDAYNMAMDLVKQKQYAKARKAFESFITQYPKDVLLPNAWYWKAETFYSLGDYPQAITTFMNIVNNYAKSPKAPDALLKIIMSYSALKDSANAKKYKETLLNSYPTSPSAKKAQQMVF